MARKKRAKKPRHKWEARAYPILLHPTEAQQKKMWHTCDGCWQLRALFVNDRNANRKENRELKQNGVKNPHYLTRADQYQAIPGLYVESTGVSWVPGGTWEEGGHAVFRV